MKSGLQIRQTQSLTLTPQLRQAIRLLLLSSVELETEISEAIEANPLLESIDDFASDGDENPSGITDEITPEKKESSDSDGDTEVAILENNEEFDWSYDEPRTSSGKSEEYDNEFGIAVPVGLSEHLLWQLRLSHLSARDVAIGEVIIEAINNDGYLLEPLESIQENLIARSACRFAGNKHRSAVDTPLRSGRCRCKKFIALSVHPVTRPKPGHPRFMPGKKNCTGTSGNSRQTGFGKTGSAAQSQSGRHAGIPLTAEKPGPETRAAN